MQSHSRPPAGTVLPALPCACANLRRAGRAVTRLYNRELSATGLEVTQYTLLMALHLRGESSQGHLGKLLALDTTTLTRMLRPLLIRGWIAAKPGKDRRQRLLSLTRSGRTKYNRTKLHWERAQERFRERLGSEAWSQMSELLGAITQATADL
jgi:DNA-binding MarR family transcriptional regulator